MHLLLRKDGQKVILCRRCVCSGLSVQSSSEDECDSTEGGHVENQEVNITDPSNNVNNASGWPGLSASQQQQFQEWYVPRARRRADGIEADLKQVLDLAEAAQARGDFESSRQYVARAHDLRKSGAAIGSVEDLQRETWAFFSDHLRG